MSTEGRTADLSPARRLHTQNSVVGVDGGGTKTEAVIMDAQQRVIGEGLAGPSNPLRVGIAGAVTAVREAIELAVYSLVMKGLETDLWSLKDKSVEPQLVAAFNGDYVAETKR